MLPYRTKIKFTNSTNVATCKQPPICYILLGLTFLKHKIMDYNKANAPECAITVVPALTELGQRLQDCTISFDRLTLELKNKLQTIKRFDEPCLKDDETKKREPECIMDELNYMVFRIHNYNNRLEECLRHLNQIA